MTEVSAEDVAQRFGIPRDDAATLLAWINIGVRFKEENLDKAPANKKEADIKPAAADAAAR